MKNTWKQIIATLLTLVMVFSLAGCGAKKAETPASDVKTLKIGYLPITHALPLFVENELATQGFENFKLELVKFGSWTELVEALNSGELDGASMLIQLALKAKQQGIGLKAVALGHRDGNVVVASKEIQSVVDLKGKTVAIPSKLSTHNILLYKLLEENGLSYSDVNVIEMTPPEMPAALAEKRIDFYLVAEPFGAQSVVNGNGQVLFESQDLWEDSLCCSLVLTDDFINNYGAAAAEFVSAYVAAGEKAQLKDEDIKTIAGKYMKTDAAVIDQSLEWIQYSDLKIKEEEYEVLLQYLADTGVLADVPSYESFVNTDLIDKAE